MRVFIDFPKLLWFIIEIIVIIESNYMLRYSFLTGSLSYSSLLFAPLVFWGGKNSDTNKHLLYFSLWKKKCKSMPISIRFQLSAFKWTKKIVAKFLVFQWNWMIFFHSPAQNQVKRHWVPVRYWYFCHFNEIEELLL